MACFPLKSGDYPVNELRHARLLGERAIGDEGNFSGVVRKLFTVSETTDFSGFLTILTVEEPPYS